jgi:hypothetical protein
VITKESYRDYLIGLKDRIFKILPMYEEKSETFDEYLSSLVNVELYGLKYVIENLPHDKWYIDSFSILIAIRFQRPPDFSDTPMVKKEIFYILKLIDKQIDQLKGG